MVRALPLCMILLGWVLFCIGLWINKRLRVENVEFGCSKWVLYEKVSDGLLYVGVGLVLGGLGGAAASAFFCKQ